MGVAQEYSIVHQRTKSEFYPKLCENTKMSFHGYDIKFTDTLQNSGKASNPELPRLKCTI